MELEIIHRSKADFLLQGALARAQGGEVMQVLLYLAADQELVRQPIGWQSPEASRVEDAWPATHVEVRHRPVESVWTVISALRELGLRVVGDSVRFSVECEGPACGVRAALELSFVTSARLERFRGGSEDRR